MRKCGNQFFVLNEKINLKFLYFKVLLMKLVNKTITSRWGFVLGISIFSGEES